MPGAQRGARLVVGGGATFGVAGVGGGGGGGGGAVKWLFEIFHGHRRPVGTRRVQGRLVDKVGEVRADQAGRRAGDDVEVDVVSQRHAASVDLQDRGATAAIGPVHDHAPVEPAGSQQSRVEDVGSVRCGDDDDCFPLVEAVHLDQELVQGLFPLVVAASEAGAALAANRVELVDENYRGSVLLTVFQETADPGSADTDEHLDELRCRDTEERHAGLARDRASQQRLPGAGRTNEQDALWHPAAELLELFWIAQEIDHFLQLELRLLDPGVIMKRCLWRARLLQTAAAAAKAEDALRRLATAPHEPDPDRDQRDERQDIQQETAEAPGIRLDALPGL